MPHNQAGGWTTLAALLPALVAGAQPTSVPGGRAAFGGRAPVQQPAVQQAAAGSLFSKVEGAEVYRKGSYMEAGDYIAKLVSAEVKQGRTKTMIILEVAILTSSYNPDVPEKQGCNQEGSRATIFVQQNENFLSNVKEIMLAVSGFDPQGRARPEDDTVTQAECDALVAPEQHYAGALVYLEARVITTKTGNPFTRISWWPCPQLADGSPDTEKLFREVR